MNTTANAPVTVGGEPIREVESFVYLGSVVDRDVTARIDKARAAFVMLKNIWASGGISMRTKLRIFHSGDVSRPFPFYIGCFTNVLVRDHVWHPYIIAGKTHWLRLFLRLMGRCLKISQYFPKTLHPAFILIETSCCVLFSIAVVCFKCLQLVTFSISVPFISILSVVSIFVVNLVFLEISLKTFFIYSV